MNELFPVPQESVEAALLASVNQDTTSWIAIESKLTSDDFTACRDVYVFMKEYLGQYQVLPTNSVLTTRFSWQPAIGEFAYWMTEMERYSKARKIFTALQDGYNRVGSNPDEAINSIIQRLSEIQAHDNNHVEAIDAGAMERLRLFDVRTEWLYNRHQMLGIPTSITILNDSLIGWMPGSVIGCFSRPQVGKTWWLMENSAIAWLAGYRSLCIEPENPQNSLTLRIDCIIGNKLGFRLDYQAIRRGEPDQREAYKNVVEVMSQHERWWSYDNYQGRNITLNILDELIRRHQPHILFIDGISLIESTVRGQTWEKMWDLSYGLQRLATRHEIPILVTTQASNQERGRRQDDTVTNARSDTFYMPSLNDVAYGDSFSQACTDLIAMCPEPTSEYINWYSIKKHRERGFRNGLPPRMGIAIDYGHGALYDLSRLGYDPAAVGQETNRLMGL